MIFLTFDRALLESSPRTIVIGRISSRNTFFKNCLALNCFAGQSVYHRTFYFWCQVLTKETNNILFLWFTSLQLSGVFDDFGECRVDKGVFLERLLITNFLLSKPSVEDPVYFLLTCREQGNKVLGSLQRRVLQKQILSAGQSESTTLWWKWLMSSRPSQLAELSRSEFDPELFSHSAYVKFFVTFAIKVPYLPFCDKMRQFLVLEMDREGGNKEKMRKCREWISLHFLILSPFPLRFLILSPFPFHFLILSPFFRSQAARLAQFVQPWCQGR